MADEPIVDLNAVDESIKNKNKVEERIKDLSEKVKLTSQERDDLAAAKQKAEEEKNAAVKERDFYASFSKSTSKYPQAGEFQDDIKSKVMSGYTVEDATVAVLASKGKLTMPAPEREMVAGGSAPTALPKSGAEKSVNEMTTAEKREKLLQFEKEGIIGLS